MKPSPDNPYTPNMRGCLLALASGRSLALYGLPTKLRLVKYGLARWVDKPVTLEITDAGRAKLGEEGLPCR